MINRCSASQPFPLPRAAPNLPVYLSRLASPYLPSPRLTSPGVQYILSCLVLPYLVLLCLASSICPPVALYIRCLTLSYLISPYLSCLLFPCLASPCLAFPSLALPYLPTYLPRLTLSVRPSPRLTSPGLAWPCVTLPCSTLPCLALPGLALP